MISLRPYQREAVDALFRWFSERQGNPLLVLPTGSGKSLVQAFFLQEALALYPAERFILVSHVRELLAQNLAKLQAVWSSAPVGVYSAGLNSRETQQQISICGIQSVYQKAHRFGDVGVVIVDEAHLIPQHDGGMYRNFIAGLQARNPALRIVGMSATPYRLDSGALHEGEHALFDGIAYEASIDRLVKEGYLCPLRSRQGTGRVSVAGLHTRGGEYIESELEQLMNTDPLVKASVDETVTLCAQRNRWIVFCCSVAHAMNVTAALRRRGISADCVTGETTLAERDGILADFQLGNLRALVNVNVLSVGFDAPDIDAVVMMRPTLSTGLYVQQCGRGMRLHPSKQDCLVLDFAGNIMQHGPLNDVSINVQRKGGTPRYKECPACHEPIPTGCFTCPLCGYVYPRRPVGCRAPDHDEHASPLDVMNNASYVEEDVVDLGFGVIRTPVRYVVYEPHQARNSVLLGKPPTLQVTYHCARREKFREWICLEHKEGSFAQRKAAGWWRARSDQPVPTSVDAAAVLAPTLKRPRKIVVNTNEKYPRVLSHLDLETPLVDLTPDEPMPHVDPPAPVVTEDGLV